MQLCNIFTYADTAVDIDIGVVDTVYDPENGFRQYHTMGRSERLIDTNDSSTGAHGDDVTKILSYMTGDPTYHFFQVINENGKYDDGNLVNAIVWATDYGIDVLNLSLGTDHFSDEDKDCDQTGPDCAITEAVEYAVENGVILVAAVGNKPGADAVCCPALSEQTIAVGGCVAKCTASLPNDGAGVPSSFHPPHSYWVERGDGRGISDSFCSMRGCAPRTSCDNNQVIEQWNGNTRFVYHTPDTLAPAVFPREDHLGLMMGNGTSFATPIVTAMVATAIEPIIESGNDPNLSNIRRLIRVSGDPLPDVPVGVLDGEQFASEVLDQYGLGSLQRNEIGSLYRT